jgi:hypothetical protein
MRVKVISSVKKEHVCEACGEIIPVGYPAVAITEFKFFRSGTYYLHYVPDVSLEKYMFAPLSELRAIVCKRLK